MYSSSHNFEQLHREKHSTTTNRQQSNALPKTTTTTMFGKNSFTALALAAFVSVGVFMPDLSTNERMLAADDEKVRVRYVALVFDCVRTCCCGR